MRFLVVTLCALFSLGAGALAVWAVAGLIASGQPRTPELAAFLTVYVIATIITLVSALKGALR